MLNKEETSKKWWQWIMNPTVLVAIIGLIGTSTPHIVEFIRDTTLPNMRVLNSEKEKHSAQLFKENINCLHLEPVEIHTEDNVKIKTRLCDSWVAWVQVDAPSNSMIKSGFKWVDLTSFKKKLASYFDNSLHAKSVIVKQRKIRNKKILQIKIEGNKYVCIQKIKNGKCQKVTTDIRTGEVIKKERVKCGQ